MKVLILVSSGVSIPYHAICCLSQNYLCQLLLCCNIFCPLKLLVPYKHRCSKARTPLPLSLIARSSPYAYFFCFWRWVAIFWIHCQLD